MVSEDIKEHPHQGVPEGAYPPHYGQAFLLSGAVVILGLVDGTAGAADEAVLPILIEGICIQQEGEVEVGEDGDG